MAASSLLKILFACTLSLRSLLRHSFQLWSLLFRGVVVTAAVVFGVLYSS